MTVYRPRISDGTSHVIAGQYSDCEDDGAARRNADVPVANRNSNIVIWDDDRQVLPVRRGVRDVHGREKEAAPVGMADSGHGSPGTGSRLKQTES